MHWWILINQGHFLNFSFFFCCLLPIHVRPEKSKLQIIPGQLNVTIECVPPDFSSIPLFLTPYFENPNHNPFNSLLMNEEEQCNPHLLIQSSLLFIYNTLLSLEIKGDGNISLKCWVFHFYQLASILSLSQYQNFCQSLSMCLSVLISSVGIELFCDRDLWKKKKDRKFDYFVP